MENSGECAGGTEHSSPCPKSSVAALSGSDDIKKNEN